MAYGQPSGTRAFNPQVADLTLDAFERCGIFAPSIEAKHMWSAKRSCNLVLGKFAVRGVNLWEVDAQPTIIDLIPGQGVYSLPADTVGMLDTYIRVPQSANPNVTIPGSAGSIVPYLQGNPIPQNAIFTTTEGSNIVSVNLPGHGFTAGEYASVIFPLLVGGITLGGVYTVQTVPDADDFTLNATFAATSNSTIVVNGQANSLDRLIYPISRNDFAAIPQKFIPGPPTSYWFQRQISPQVQLWPVPDTAAPYQLLTYLLHQVEDASPVGGQTFDLPYRFLYAFTAELALDLAIKFAADKYEMLKLEATGAWKEASEDDREKVDLFFGPDVSGY